MRMASYCRVFSDRWSCPLSQTALLVCVKSNATSSTIVTKRFRVQLLGTWETSVMCRLFASPPPARRALQAKQRFIPKPSCDFSHCTLEPCLDILYKCDTNLTDQACCVLQQAPGNLPAKLPGPWVLPGTSQSRMLLTNSEGWFAQKSCPYKHLQMAFESCRDERGLYNHILSLLSTVRWQSLDGKCPVHLMWNKRPLLAGNESLGTVAICALTGLFPGNSAVPSH